ncbi:hypothetical protein, partial [Acinetobacter johnsonii]|uniref:hypothetical protein n=1 Tax=Acinetobacter johnsonii TaxID=40214 RepID=UPI001F30A05E
ATLLRVLALVLVAMKEGMEKGKSALFAISWDLLGRDPTQGRILIGKEIPVAVQGVVYVL